MNRGTHLSPIAFITFFFFIKSGRSPEWVGYLETLRKPALLFVLVIYFILAERG